jgi:outer membrane receptor protein involved in Fe transport
VFGDSSLVRTLVQNYDARWEWYPTTAEVLSIGLFAKRFDKPIEPIDVATSGASQLSFINAESAMNYGIELEVRKGLEFLGEALVPYSVFANSTFMYSRINTSNSALSALSNDERPMVGQAPYVVNAGLAYSSESGATSATLLYNVVGRRISSAAIVPLNADTYEESRQLLDFSIRVGISEGMSAKLDAKNLFDSPYEERQGDVIRYSYRTGRSLSLGLSWKVQ